MEKNYFVIIGKPVTFNGIDSYLAVELDTRLVPFGDSGSFKFRSRDQTATLMLIQLYYSDSNLPVTSLEFSLYQKNLQVTVKSNTGSYFCDFMPILFIFLKYKQ